MARDFCLSIEQGFRENRKFKKFCRLMGSPLAFGHMIALWEWASNHAPDGDLSKIDEPEIEDAAGYQAADGRCYAAMVDAGFIDEGPDGARNIHAWMEPGRTGYALAAREKERARWRRAKGIPERQGENGAGNQQDSARNPEGIPEESHGTIRETSVVPASSRFTVHGSDPPSASQGSDPDQTRPREDHVKADAAAQRANMADYAAKLEAAIGDGDANKPGDRAHAWLRAFCAAWCERRGAISHNGGIGATKATATLADEIANLSDDAHHAAWLRRGAMFAEFFSDPENEPAGFRFSWFVQRFEGLRLPRGNRAARPPPAYATIPPRKRLTDPPPPEPETKPTP